MGVPQLNQCCCGCTLKTGTIIIAVLTAIGGVIFLATGIVACSIDPQGADPDAVTALRATGAVAAVVGALILTAAILAMVGATKDKPNLLIPYMVMILISIIVNIINSSIAAARYYEISKSSEGTSQIVGLILYILLEGYFLLVVYSLYREQKGESTSPHP